MSWPACRCGQQGAAYGSRAVAGWEPDMWSARELTRCGHQVEVKSLELGCPIENGAT